MSTIREMVRGDDVYISPELENAPKYVLTAFRVPEEARRSIDGLIEYLKDYINNHPSNKAPVELIVSTSNPIPLGKTVRCHIWAPGVSYCGMTLDAVDLGDEGHCRYLEAKLLAEGYVKTEYLRFRLLN